MTRPRSAAIILAAATLAAGCGDDDLPDTVREQGPFISGPATVRQVLESAGVAVRRVPAAPVRTLPRARGRAGFLTEDGTRLTVLTYRSPQVALRARPSARRAAGGGRVLGPIDNLLVVRVGRGEDAALVQEALEALAGG